MKTRFHRLPATALVAAMMLAGLPACGEKGTLEQAAEEADEGVDTLRRGEESTASKMDDAVDEAREAAKGVGEDVREGANRAAGEIREEVREERAK
jgi:predicted small lipoprotein YifL